MKLDIIYLTGSGENMKFETLTKVYKQPEIHALLQVDKIIIKHHGYCVYRKYFDFDENRYVIYVRDRTQIK